MRVARFGHVCFVVLFCFVFLFLHLQEEDFADTGYQVNSSDPGAGAANTPNASAVEQLGALTAADFDRKPGAINDDTRLVNSS